MYTTLLIYGPPNCHTNYYLLAVSLQLFFSYLFPHFSTSSTWHLLQSAYITLLHLIFNSKNVLLPWHNNKSTRKGRVSLLSINMSTSSIDIIIDNPSNNLAVDTGYKFCGTHTILLIQGHPLTRARFFWWENRARGPTCIESRVVEGRWTWRQFLLFLLFSLRRGSL